MQGMPPPPEFVPLTPKAAIQTRSGFFGLALFLVSCLCLVNLLLVSMGGRIVADLTTRHAPGKLLIPDHFTSFLIAIELVGIVCIGATWTWRRWGIYGYFVTDALFVLLVMKLTGKPPMLDVIGFTAMVFTALPRLHMFE
jgi:hypothetical protein